METDRPSARGRPVAAFVISLIAGLWMLVMGGMVGGWGHMGAHGPGGTMHEGVGRNEWMWRHHQWMFEHGGGQLWSWVGIVAGIGVLVGAVGLYSRPAMVRTWGAVVLVASAVDLLAGAGGIVAGTLGIIGGVLAMSWKPGAG